MFSSQGRIVHDKTVFTFVIFILIKFGIICWERDYYYDKIKARYAITLDQMLGIKAYGTEYGLLG